MRRILLANTALVFSLSLSAQTDTIFNKTNRDMMNNNTFNNANRRDSLSRDRFNNTNRDSSDKFNVKTYRDTLPPNERYNNKNYRDTLNPNERFNTDKSTVNPNDRFNNNTVRDTIPTDKTLNDRLATGQKGILCPMKGRIIMTGLDPIATQCLKIS